ncbi:PadR family transcriptional regulator [Luedemannella flava]|uniref:PadR family transcriptional regulator n=1 Tax=Luedemannella flava TaxID=349316 RepID=A0ABP4YND2_9ACTN
MPRRPDTSPQTLRVFAALLEDPEGWHYGYALSKRTGLPSGTLYPILMRLAERELLTTRWEEATTPGRPPRHAYQLTPDGTALARDRVAQATPAPASRVRPAAHPRTAS